jgi:SagB-type dehydrogenase family enzyme
VSSRKPRSIGAEFQFQTKFRRGQLPAARGRVAPKFKVYANPQEIAKLPQPHLKGGSGVWTAMSAARGEAEGGRVKDSQLAQLLWAAGGFTVGGERVPLVSQSVSSVEVYVLALQVRNLLAGVYHYDPREHSLEHLSVGDPLPALNEALLTDLDLTAQAALLCFTGVPGRHRAVDGGRPYRYIHIDAGAAAQAAALAAAGMGLATRLVTDFYDDELAELIKVDGRDEHPLCLLAVGP